MHTYVNDFVMVGNDSKAIMEMIQAIYGTAKFIGPADYYLGNDYKKDQATAGP